MVMVAIMGVMMTMAAQQWSFIERREMEKELIYRGQRIAAAIGEFERQAQNQRRPTKLEDMTKGPRPTLRRVWHDPMTARYDSNGDLVEETGEFELLTPASPQAGAPGGGTPPGQRTRSPINIQGINGVASQSDELSIAGWTTVPPGSPYTEWRFEAVYLDRSTVVNPVRGGESVELRPPGYGGDARAPGAPPPPGSPLGTGLAGAGPGRP
jgi:hypothetical protein